MMPAWLREKLRDGRAFGTPLIPPPGEEALDPHGVYDVTTFAHNAGGKWRTVTSPMPGHRVLAAVLALNGGGWLPGTRVVVPCLHLFPDQRSIAGARAPREDFIVPGARVTWVNVNALRTLLQDAGMVALDWQTGAQLAYGRYAHASIAEEVYVRWQEQAREAEAKGDGHGRARPDGGTAAHRAAGRRGDRSAQASDGPRAAAAPQSHPAGGVPEPARRA